MIIAWILFNLFVLGMLAFDLLVIHKDAHAVSHKEAIRWTVIWIVLALLFGAGIYYFQGLEPALNYLTGYVIEKALSVDNLFVFLIIFGYFHVPEQYRHVILFWGVLGALIMRALFIFAGVILIQKFFWITYLFGIFLVYTGLKFWIKKGQEVHPEKNPLLNWISKFIPITTKYEQDHFFVRQNGRLLATPLFLVLIAIESSDIVFALDSVPAILAITTDPFIVYTSNVFAILGLRALYFALSHLMKAFTYLQYALAIILIFIGAKMLLENVIHIPILFSLGFILLTLATAAFASLKTANNNKTS